MNLKQFRQIIREETRNAVREELGLLLLEQKKQSITENFRQGNGTGDYVPPITFTTSDVDRVGLRNKLNNQIVQNSPELVNVQGANPFAAFLKESANTMTPQERSGLKNLD